MSIYVQGLTRIFEEQVAVDRISFEIKPGNIVGFLGPNGAGKSTTMKMLTTFLPPTAGKAEICGIDILRQPQEVRRHVGYLPEKNPLYTDLYVRECLELVAGVHRIGRRKKQVVDDMIALTGLSREVHKKIGTLSKGYRQRVGLAQAMLHQPEVLILDEPTSGLDPNQLTEIRDLILQIGKERTVLLSTHIMQEVQALCSRVIIINKGKIVADDDLQQIGRTASPAEALLVEFESPVAADALQHLPQLEAVEPHLNGQQLLLWSSQPDNLRKALMKWSLEQENAIVTLQKFSPTLEETFRSLTKDPATGEDLPSSGD